MFSRIASQEVDRLKSSLLVVLVAVFMVQETRGADRVTMTHGPMLGRPGSSSMTVWARTSRPSIFEVRYGTSPDSMDQSAKSSATLPMHDNTGTVELSGLLQDTKYHYQVFIDELPQKDVASFKTLPGSMTHPSTDLNPTGLHNLRFEVGSCSNQNPEHGIGHSLPTYQTMNRELVGNVDFAIMNGDWLYEELRDTPAQAWITSQRLDADEVPSEVQVMPTIVGVWENYKLYLARGVPLAKWHQHVPSFFTIDDHELVNDIWGTGTAGRRHRRSVFRDIGTRAFDDYLGWANYRVSNQEMLFGLGQLKEGSDLLIDPKADFSRLKLDQLANLHVHWGTPTAGVNEIALDDDSGDPNSRVYDVAQIVSATTLKLHMPAKRTGAVSYSIGRRNYGTFRTGNCEFYLLDTRSHRDMHDVQSPSNPSLSMLGKEQRKWLEESMTASDAEFFFVISSVPMMIPHNGAGGFESDAANKEESWVAFQHERDSLIDFWDKLNRPVMVMTGDLHNSFSIRVTDRVWEFCCGPHNSVNHVPKLDEGDRPINGRYLSGKKECDIRWSSYILPDLPRTQRHYPYYCVVQVNNVFNMPTKLGGKRWVAYPVPQVILQYFDGRSGKLAYSETIHGNTLRKQGIRTR
jgi:alkaline phosphatase D